MTNQFEVVSKQLTEQDKEDILKYKKINITAMQNNVYDSGALAYFFNLWKIHFPKVNQSMSCQSCRKSVVMFYHKLAEYIITQQETKEFQIEKEKKEQKEKPKVVKTKKIKTNG